MPGQTAHPRRHVRGHSYGLPEPRPPAFAPAAWRESEWYRYGVDLYNFGYWWECHEVFEGLWHAVGHETEQGQCFQGLIQVAAANLKRFQGNEGAAEALFRRGLARLAQVPSPYMGIAVRAFERDVQGYVSGSRKTPALIRLMSEDAPR